MQTTLEKPNDDSNFQIFINELMLFETQWYNQNDDKKINPKRVFLMIHDFCSWVINDIDGGKVRNQIKCQNFNLIEGSREEASD